MQCPKCLNTSLVTDRVQAIDVDRCERCGGIWFDDQELITLLHESLPQLTPLRGRTAPEGLNRKHGVCPQDATELLRVSSALGHTVVVDSCPQCRGIWLDGGEFGTLLKSIGR